VHHGVVEHVLDVIELGIVVFVGCVDAPVDNPVVAGLDIHVQASNHPDAVDQAVGVATVLLVHQLDLLRDVDDILDNFGMTFTFNF
jgi:hypothetical protein